MELHGLMASTLTSGLVGIQDCRLSAPFGLKSSAGGEAGGQRSERPLAKIHPDAKPRGPEFDHVDSDVIIGYEVRPALDEFSCGFLHQHPNSCKRDANSFHKILAGNVSSLSQVSNCGFSSLSLEDTG